ncbi:MAG: ABC transporter substrate-binding protein [Clostridiales bacterium]|nr:ABC transporter substrate-binding protein [Clostridiales bacterium]
MKKIIIALAAVMILAAGCGQNGAGSAGVEITVVSPFDSGDTNRENFVKAYRAYETASGYTVIDRSSPSNEDWKAGILEDFEAGREPDVLFFFHGADADRIVQSGKVVSISDIRKEYPDYAANMKDSMMPVSTANGRQYAVPVNGYWEGLYVNKKVLANCGVAIPGADYTWERFLADCAVIRDKGYTPIACSLMDVPHYWFEFCVFNHGNLSSHPQIPGQAGDAAGRKWASGLLDIRELYELGFLPENTATAPDSEINYLMTENKAAFMIDGSWKIGWFQANTDRLEDFMVAYVPARGERLPTDIIGGLSMGYYITKKAWDDPRKREACVAFVSAMTADEVVSSFGALSVTALKGGTTPPRDADALVVSALAMTKNCTGIVGAVQDQLTTDARTSLFDDVAGIAAGAVAPEDAIGRCLALQR